MVGIRRTGNFFLSFFLSLLLNIGGTVPAWILLGLHFWQGWPLWLFGGALGIWLAGILISTLAVHLASRCSRSAEKPKENKNPYSAE